MTFSVLFVCTGNICRSPTAERLFSARIDPQLAIAASSAGTAALVDHPMDPLSALAVRELGGNPDGHSGRQLSLHLVRHADLVLTAETAHRSFIVQTDPGSFRRIFTVREFARLGATAPENAGDARHPTEDELRSRVGVIADRRGQGPAVAPGDDDIADPLGAPMRVARGCAADISAAVDGIIAALGLTRS